MDGASRGNPGLAGAGGLILDLGGSWIGGFMHNIGRASSMMAELWGVHSGLDLAWSLGRRRLILEVDSTSVQDLLVHQMAKAPLLRPSLQLLGTCLLETGRSGSYTFIAREIAIQIGLLGDRSPGH
ncbi:hypothetical protein CRG98_039019 [Punica granatum]|uniref:RNase H type-1 domain-containing protein n=1 Tax=Punica granatum TaxID=22663 RepID=A0A2I0I9D3_PUNGR|nr:hypothetical protein CRG98_039019 [Punica granatum]